MNIAANSALWFLPFVAPIAVWAAYSDLSRMKIPNKSVMALILIFLVIGIITLPFDGYLFRFLHFFVVLLVGFLLAMTGLVGAGDAKFAAAMAPFVAVSDISFVMILFAVIAFVSIVLHRIAKHTPLRSLAPNWESWTREKDFPMGLPLAATLVFYLGFSALA